MGRAGAPADSAGPGLWVSALLYRMLQTDRQKPLLLQWEYGGHHTTVQTLLLARARTEPGRLRQRPRLAPRDTQAVRKLQRGRPAARPRPPESNSDHLEQDLFKEMKKQ